MLLLIPGMFVDDIVCDSRMLKALHTVLVSEIFQLAPLCTITTAVFVQQHYNSVNLKLMHDTYMRHSTLFSLRIASTN